MSRLLLLTALLLWSGPALACSGSIDSDLVGWARYYGEGFGLDPDLLVALVWTESRFCPTAVSPVGAVGLGQFMPGTAAGVGIDPWDPLQNLWGSAKYLRSKFEEFGDWVLALAAYNAGSGAVRRYGGVPPFEETQGYVVKVLEAYHDVRAGRIPRLAAAYEALAVGVGPAPVRDVVVDWRPSERTGWLEADVRPAVLESGASSSLAPTGVVSWLEAPSGSASEVGAEWTQVSEAERLAFEREVAALPVPPGIVVHRDERRFGAADGTPGSSFRPVGRVDGSSQFRVVRPSHGSASASGASIGMIDGSTASAQSVQSSTMSSYSEGVFVEPVASESVEEVQGGWTVIYSRADD